MSCPDISDKHNALTSALKNSDFKSSYYLEYSWSPFLTLSLSTYKAGFAFIILVIAC